MLVLVQAFMALENSESEHPIAINTGTKNHGGGIDITLTRSKDLVVWEKRKTCQ